MSPEQQGTGDTIQQCYTDYISQMIQLYSILERKENIQSVGRVHLEQNAF